MPAPLNSGKDSKSLPQVRTLAAAICQELEARLVGVDFVSEGSHRYLRVLIDEPGGAQLKTCEKVSKALSRELDRMDLIQTNYFLEVSSPGASEAVSGARGPGEEEFR